MGNEIMPNWLEKRVELSPERVALVTTTETWTFATLQEKTLRLAKKLTTLGVQTGDHIAVLMDNKAEFVAMIHAIEYIGAVAVLLNTRLTSYELLWQLNDARVKLVIYDDQYKEKVVVDISAGSSPQIDGDAGKDTTIAASFKSISLSTLKETPETECKFRMEFDLTNIHTIIYTSGTTGKPKGVMLTYGNHWWNAVGSSLNLGLHSKDSWLCCLPLFHVGGLSILLRSVFYGIPVVLHEKFVPEKINDSIFTNKITLISVVSQMLHRMLTNIGAKSYPESLRCVLLGGGPAPKPLLEECRQRKIPLFQTYGMTETASQVATLSSEYMLTKIGSAGKPLFPAQLRIEKDGRPAQPGEAGEIVVKGPNVALGYWNREFETSKAIKDGWLYTGDIGFLDEDGFLFVLDRRNDMIISGGENIYPAEVESVLLAYPAVEEAGVVGMDNEKWGQVPIAFIKKKPDVNVKEAEIIAFAQARLAKYKVPTKIYFVDVLPRNASNKLMRHKLKELI